MFITKLTLFSELGLEAIFNPYETHREVWKLFNSESRNFLFSSENLSNHWEITILSTVAPNRPVWATEKNFITKEIDPSFFKHKKYQFRIKANATKRSMKTHKRVSIQGEENLLNWMKSKGELHGFALESCAVQSQRKVTFEKKGCSGTHNVVSFSGTLKVTDKEKFMAALATGIGSSKGFGYGMMQVIPIK